LDRYLLVIIALVICLAGFSCGTREDIRVVERSNTEQTNNFYVGNRPPLTPSAFMKLPIGAIKPQGWVRKQLELEADGFTGHMAELSAWCEPEGYVWLNPDMHPSSWDQVAFRSPACPHWGELTPMWLRGFSNLGYMLGDQRIINEASRWIEGVMDTQLENGYFGPRRNLNGDHNTPSDRGKGGTRPHLRANMVMLKVFETYHEYSGDSRILEVMSKYFRWLMTIPDENFLWEPLQKTRGGNYLKSVYWLYNRTGEKWLLDLAEKIHRNTADWTSGLVTWHGFDIAMNFNEPGVFYQQSKDPKHLAAVERNYQNAMGIFGQMPGGLFVSDEGSRPGYTDPQLGSESCMIVLFMDSHETMLKITGDPRWADRCEEVVFNSLPASMTADLKALHYFGAPNMTVIDWYSKHHRDLDFRWHERLFSPHCNYCCTHNLGMGWPYYAEHLWLATPGNGLASVMYAPCRVTAKVGDGSKVTIIEETLYPFDENIQLTVTTVKPVRFPLYLRVPVWCDNPKVQVNGKAASVKARPRSYIVIDRKWSDGDRVSLELPMKIKVKTWTKNKNSVSVHRGPLAYSLKIGEKYIKLADGGELSWWSIGDTDKWPAWKVHPTTPWNYGLVLNKKNLAKSFKIVRKSWSDNSQPFEANAAPIELRVKAKRIPAWKINHLGITGRLQPSPVKSDEPTETVTLIPMGCARLRLSAFPMIGTGPDAHEWEEISFAAASHTTPEDGYGLRIPENSGDGHTFLGFTWWDRKGSSEWVQYEFAQSRKISTVDVYWYEDQYHWGMPIRVPESWRLRYKSKDGKWKEVPNASGYGVENGYNRVTFDPVDANGLRIDVKLQPGFSVGIVEWRVE